MTDNEASLAAANALEDAIDRKIAKAAAKRTRTTARVERIAPDGTVWVVVDGAGTETPASGTAASVAPGDMVNVTVTGGRLTVDGNTTDPSAGVVRVRRVEIVADEAAETAGNAVRGAAAASQAALNAQRTADEAQAVAEATDQHFWSDTDGIHVTDVTQDKWKDSGSADYHAGHNILINSLGLLLRKALNNLVSITRSAIAFFDGEGNASSNIVASFGAEGAQIGKADSSHIELGADSMSIVNEDGATMFDVDMDAGAMYAYGGENRAQQGPEDVIKATATGSYTKQVVYQVAFEGLSSGDKVIIPAGSVLALNYSRVNSSIFADMTIQSISSGMTYTQSGYNKAYSITSDMQLVYGTAIQDKTYTVTGTVTKTSASVNGSFTTTITFSYSGGSSFTITVSTSLTVSSMSAEWLDFNIFAWNPGYKSYIQTKGAALAFGTRQPGADIGLLSATFGEGLIASSEKQAVFGAYNVEDANDTYAAIIGNGTADDARSNAYAQKWDGTHVFANNTTIWDNSSGNTHLLTPEVGTKQAEYSFEGGGLYVRKRTRTSTSAAWGSWSSWTLIG